ncbi:hypothetical protein CPB83DRAFT_890706 [Crepidotus variabilis]|uniref:Uncharacterized protein n=1 Tax=Crepidotus variabilis TaxID=179855 RepID=A0A9P6JU58_9AGAR|nr:hypothetical protein CPB83DRAFT_890706 [Crepidotus variabilis]
MRKNSNSQFQKGKNTVDASIPRVDIDLTADGNTDDSGSHSTDEDFPIHPPLKRNPKVEPFDEASLPSTQHLLLDFDQDTLRRPPLIQHPRLYDVDDAESPAALPPFRNPQVEEHEEFPPLPPLYRNSKVEGSLSLTSTIPAQPNFRQKPFVEISRKRMRSLTPPRVFSPPTASTARSAKAPTAIPPKSRLPPASD